MRKRLLQWGHRFLQLGKCFFLFSRTLYEPKNIRSHPLVIFSLDNFRHFKSDSLSLPIRSSSFIPLPISHLPLLPATISQHYPFDRPLAPPCVYVCLLDDALEPLGHLSRCTAINLVCNLIALDNSIPRSYCAKHKAMKRLGSF